MKSALSLLCFLVLAVGAQAQDTVQDTTKKENNFLSRIFLPSVDAGYQFNLSDQLGGSVKLATSIEYRVRNNNDMFLRLNYDTYSASFSLNEINATSNNIKGRAQFTDLLLSPGYRFGDRTMRLMFSAGAGVKFYNYPTATVVGQDIIIDQGTEYIFTTSFMTTMEYYFHEKSAFTFTLFQNQVWEPIDFWEDNGSAFGFSFGFITALE